MNHIPDDARYKSPTGTNIYYCGPSKKGGYQQRSGNGYITLAIVIQTIVLLYVLLGGGSP